MRSAEEMFELIIETAQQDERIRAVILNGSRANPNAPQDPFQDFDVVYIVTDVAPFKYNYEWLQRFGELMMMQMPDDMVDPPPGNDDSFAYLMQFADGNRIDLGLYPLAKVGDLGQDSLSVLLLDKDGIIAPFAPPDESDYLPKLPTAKAFANCCNEFWWVCPYVAKGLWRGEIIYAKYMLDRVVRDQLFKMIVWYIGVKTQFAKNPGKFGKYFESYLEPELWELLQQTYSDASYEQTWAALFAMTRLFRPLALPVAEHFGFAYPHGDAARVTAHLHHVKALPRTAKEIY